MKCKPYCLRYRVCPAHLNAAVVELDGVASRFCQQCGKFHRLEDFDGSKKWVYNARLYDVEVSC